MLINHGANVDSQDNCGWTILHEAILGKITKVQDVSVFIHFKSTCLSRYYKLPVFSRKIC